jgi:hypothetical protein
VNYIQEYLVRIGTDVDTPAFEKLNGVLRDADMAVNRFATGALKHILEAQVGIVGAFVSMSGAVVGLVDKVAMADLGYQKMSIKMMMSAQSVRSLDIVTKALGASLEEIWWTPELRERAGDLMGFIGKLNQGLGADFEPTMKRVRDMRQEFTKFKVGLQFLGMDFAAGIFKKMFPNDDAMTKMKGMVGAFADRIPEIADKLATYAVPILKDTWSIMKGIGEAVKTGALAFTNLIGVFSGDNSIEGAAFSFDKMAKGIEHVVGWMKTLVDWITRAESMLAHFAAGMSLVLAGNWKGAGAEFMSGMAQVGSGPGAIIGGTIGMAVGGPVGAAEGAAIGVGIGGTAKAAQNPSGIMAGLKDFFGLKELSTGGVVGVTLGGILGGPLGAAVGLAAGVAMTHWFEDHRGLALGSVSAGTGAPQAGGSAQLDQRILGAIGGFEAGNDPNALSIRNNNAGNLMDHGVLRKFSTKEEGDQAALDQIDRFINRGLTLNELIAKWAPADDGKTPALKGNNPVAYAARVARQLGGIDPNVPLKQIQNPTLPQMGASLRGGGSKMEINGMSIYVMQPNATAAEIGQAVAAKVSLEFDRRNQLGMPAVAGAWG